MGNTDRKQFPLKQYNLETLFINIITVYDRLGG